MKLTIDTSKGDQLTINGDYVWIKSDGKLYGTMKKYVRFTDSKKKLGLERFTIYECEVEKFVDA